MSKTEVGLEYSQRIQDALQRLFHERGRGTKARVERELNLYDGFFDNRRARGDLNLGVVLAALLYLEQDVGGFINEALGRPKAPEGEPPEVSSEIASVIAQSWGLPSGGER